MKKTVLLLVFLFFISFTYCQETHSKKLDHLFKFYEQQNLFNGCVLVSKNGEILLKKGYGQENVELNKKINSKSIFQIYSVTKTFTSTVIFKLIEEKKLSLTDKLSKFYPDYPDGETISIENLLTHTSGIYDYSHGNNMPDQSEKSFINFQKTKPLDFPSGTSWSYSNSGYYFLGYIIQKVTGLTYEQVVNKYIFTPLQMKQSGFAFKYLNSKHKAIGYEMFLENIKRPSIIYDPPGPFAAGGIYSTIEDLYKYYNGLKKHKIVSKELLDKAYTPFKSNYGYGWIVLPMFDKITIGHSGAGAGFMSNFIQIPEDDICIILLTNTERDLNNATSAILKILYDKPFKIPAIINTHIEDLKQYVGTYEVSTNFNIYLSIENGKLIAQSLNQPKSILYPEKENQFYAEELSGNVRFEKNKSQQVEALVFKKGGLDTKAMKIFPTWGIVGSAAQNGWEGPDEKLIAAEEKGIWVIKNVSLQKGEFKFRFNNDWTINLGTNENNELMKEGNNFTVEKGIYKIILDLSDEKNPKYKIDKE